MHIPKPPKFKRSFPLIPTPIPLLKSYGDKDCKFLDANELIHTFTNQKFQVETQKNIDVFTSFEFSCSKLRIRGVFRNDAWNFFEDYKKPIPFARVLDLMISNSHICRITNHDISALFNNNNIEVLYSKKPVELFALLMFYFNINSAFSYLQINEMDSEYFGGVHTIFNDNKIMWEKNCHNINTNLFAFSAKPFSLDFIEAFCKSEFDGEITTFANIKSNIFDYNLELYNLLSIAQTNPLMFFQFEPQGFFMWRYALTLLVYKTLSFAKDESFQNIIESIGKLINYSDIWKDFADIVEVFNENGFLGNIFLIDDINAIFNTFYKVDNILDLCYICFKQSTHTFSDFSLMYQDKTFVIAPNKNEITRSLEHLLNRFSLTQLLNNEEQITFFDANYSFNFSLAVITVNCIIAQDFHKLHEILLDLQLPHRSFSNFSQIFSISKIRGICHYYNTLLIVYKDIEQLFESYFTYLLFKIKTKTNIFDTIYDLLSLKPKAQHYKILIHEMLKANKHVFNVSEMKDLSNMIINPLTQVFYIDLSTNPNNLKYEVYA